MKIKYYKTKEDALKSRLKGDRIYYDSKKRLYYLITPKKQLFWCF